MKSRSIRYLLQVARLASIGVFVIAGTHFFLLQPSEVNGRSMEDTLVDQEIILIDKASLLFREPERGDIISVIRDGFDEKLVKRVIGLPGEQVILQDGQVYVITAQGNMITLEEPYLQEQVKTYPPEGEYYSYATIPEDSFFVMGDNREYSYDSRVYGSVHRTEIVGVVRQIRRD